MGANKFFGAVGVIAARFIDLEKKPNKKRGGEWATVNLDVDGHTLRAVSFNEKVIADLSGYAKHEQIVVLLSIKSRKVIKDGEERVYNDVDIRKVYTDGTKEGGLDITVKGEITKIGDLYSNKDPKKKVARFVDIDITEKEEYPTLVRLQLEYGTDLSLEVGKGITTYAHLNKIGLWVFEGDIKKEMGGGPLAGTTVIGSKRPKPTEGEASAPAAELPAVTDTKAPAQDIW